MVSAANPRIMHRCFNSAVIVTGREDARNAGRMSPRRWMLLPAWRTGQAFHDHEGFYIRKRSKPFAIMEMPWETRLFRQRPSGNG
jgi:hypothetical protein